MAKKVVIFSTISSISLSFRASDALLCRASALWFHLDDEFTQPVALPLVEIPLASQVVHLFLQPFDVFAKRADDGSIVVFNAHDLLLQ